MFALPDIGEAAGAVGLGNAFLERIAVRVGGLVGRRLAEDAAQIDEMLLRRPGAQYGRRVTTSR